MAAISVLPPIHLQPRVIDSHPEVAGVVVSPEHVVDVEDYRLPGHVQYGGFLHLLGCQEKSLFSGREKQSSHSHLVLPGNRMAACMTRSSSSIQLKGQLSQFSTIL